jgi:lipid-A-disaccharide synthase
MSTSTTIMIIAGEVSGDQHAGALVAALREHDPALRVFGIGGPHMRAAGVETLVDIGEMAIMGLAEVMRRYGFFRRVFRRMLAEARRRGPEAVILVDYPGFNLRFAARAHAMGIKVIYYICPQVWAWRQSRIPKMARSIDRLISIFPFEARCFEGSGLHVDFAGHPLVDEAARVWGEPEPHLPWGGAPRVALLPGSRLQEIERLLPDVWAGACAIERRFPGASFILAAPSEHVADVLRAAIAAQPAHPSRWELVTGNTRHVLRQATAAIVASGTATLEASLMLCPMVIVYRVAPLTYAIGRRLVTVKCIGMVNIVAGEAICPELIQGAVTPEAIALAMDPLLRDADASGRMRDALQRVNAKLGHGGAAQRAAAAVLDALRA